MQLIVAGKAHPADVPGKEVLRGIVRESQRGALHDRVAFLEDYDMHMARYLVQGADVWLNLPGARSRPRAPAG